MFKNTGLDRLKALARSGPFLLLASAASGASLPLPMGGAANPATAAALKQIVAQIYKPYLGPGSDSRPEPPALADAVKPYASRTLNFALAAQQNCEIKTQDECAPDFDVVVDGQDWTIPNAPDLVPAVVSQTEIDINASFLSIGTPISIFYVFKKTDTAWRLDDIRGRSAGGKPDIWSLRKLLAMTGDDRLEPDRQ